MDYKLKHYMRLKISSISVVGKQIEHQEEKNKFIVIKIICKSFIEVELNFRISKLTYVYSVTVLLSDVTDDF